jgi:serine/threonine protein kinase
MKIALGAVRGLTFIHHSCKSPKLAHGNIKSSNVLLDKSGNACISDFGLAVLISPASAASRAAGYRAPEQAETRRISQKADVYSFGVLLLEILTGKAPVQLHAPDESIDLPKWVQSVVREEWTAEVFDLELMRYKNIEEEMVGMLQIAMVCVSVPPEQRPKMSHVVKMIEEIRGEQSPMHESFDSLSQSPSVSKDLIVSVSFVSS